MSDVEVAGERSGVKGHEPSMFLERPSSARSHDIRHILTRTFRELFTSDVISPETVDNLTISRHNQDPYHQRYVSNLQQICGERERRLAECAMLERHIMQAQARAMSSEEKELNEITSSCQNYFELGVPAGQSHFRGSLDSELLRSHGLLVPEDYSTDLPALSKPPVGSAMPNYLRATMSSENHLTPRNSGLSPLPPIVSGAQESLDEQDDQDSSNSVSDNSVEDTGEQMNKLWQSHLGSEQREVDKADLSKLDAKVNFLRNPRHVPPSAPSGGRTLIAKNTVKPKEVGIKPLPEKPVPKEPSVVFLASPPVVMFSKYAVGQVYEKVVELKNITTVLRPCRVLPPCTPYFSVGLGQFPGEHGLVAPGMSCHYTVRFSPDSLGDYEDEIRIQTQSSAPMVIQLRAGRQPPLLTLPEELDVGYCLVGALHVVHFLVRNEGGPGRFCLMPTAAWPAASFKSTVKNGTVSFPSFEVRPSVFELLAGNKTVIEVAFRPEAVGDYSENISMVCDNCQVKHFKLKGESQRAAVRLTEVEGGMDTALPGEITDVSAQHLVKFEQLNPYTYTDKAIYIKNQTNVEMRFSWEMYKPVLKSKTIEEISDQTLETGAMERVTHIDSVFSIHPATATLAPDNIMEFKITFAPPLVGDFSSVLHMILQQIPCPPPDLLSLQSPATSHSSISVDSVAEKSNASQTFTMPSLQESTALQLEVKGQCVPLSVVLHPYAMVVPGTFLVGVTIKKQVVLVNHSYSGISFRWQPYTEDHILEIEPPFGELGPGMALDLELSITGAKPGKINHTLFCYVDNLEEPVHLHVEADIKGSDICVEQADVHFGLVLLGESATREITLTNMSQSITEWSIRESPLQEETPFTQAESVFVFSPFSGALRPLERKSIRVTFTPSESQSLNTTFVVETPDGHLCTVRVYGEVQVPRACLLSCELTLEEVYSGVGVMQPFKLLNQTLLPTSFHWGQVEGPDSDCVSVSVEPQEGLLRPREELTLYLSFTARNQSGEVCVRVPCDVEGMDHPLWLSVSGDVRGLSVSYQVSSHGLGTSMFEESLELNYGDEISLGDTPKQYLHICNQSGITAPFSLQVGYFSGKPPTPPNATPGNTSTKGRVGLRRTPNLADPFARTSTKAYQEVCQTMLREGKGAAFIMYPAYGELAPFSEEVIEVTAFSDMWGEYTDTLTIKVGDLEPMLVPVSMTVVGCPLNFQLTAALPNQSPIVRFGSHIAGTQSISRKLRVNNTSPFDIRLDWETFTVSADDRKLVDLVVRYGDTFPVRDADGNEIVPANTLPASRQNSGNRNCTFSSSKTTLAGSRQVTDLISDLPSDDSEPVDSSNEEKPKIISTFLRLHDGIETDSPYEVFPKQLLIPAKSSGAVSVKFKPLPTSTVSKGMDCLGYAHAYMTLDDKGSGTDGLVKRRQGFDMDTLRVDMTAFVKPALLTIECAEEEGMRFRGAMSDLRQGAENSAVHRNICVASLANQTETPITFRLCLMSPFRLVDLDPTSNADGSRSATVTDMCTLKPQHTLPVKVEFGVEMDLLKFLDALETGEEVDGIELEVRGQERRLQFLYYLQVQFNNTAIQYLPLHATLSVPSLVLSRETLDFGTCLVGQRRELELTVSNPTASSSYWVITTERMTETCVEDTFTLTPSSGQLEAHVTYVSDSQTLIKVFFIAKHAELYEAVFVFQGELGEEPRRLFVTGQGSYDGKHEAVVNV